MKVTRKGTCAIKRLRIRGLGLDFDVLCITSGLLFCSAMSMHGVLGASLMVIQDWCHLFSVLSSCDIAYPSSSFTRSSFFSRHWLFGLDKLIEP